MKKEQLKEIIKPLIKECLKEVLVEEGFSKMLSETREKVEVKHFTKPIQQTVKLNLQENKRKMLDAIGQSGFDPFSGSEPLKEDKEVLSSNPGVDISSLLNENKAAWKQTLNALNGKKDKE